jgi:hypothetical protein
MAELSEVLNCRGMRIRMSWLRCIVIPAFLAAAVTCGAQTTRGPEFRLEPGLLSADFISAPPLVTSTTGFNVRFETRLATSHRWLTPVIGASIAPYGTSGSIGRNLNTPVIFFGNAFPFVRSAQTGGWATVELPLFLYYSYGGGGPHNRRIYGRDVFLQVSTHLHLGAKALHDLGPFWSRVGVYADLEQNLTPNRVGNRSPDRFNPVGLVGLSIPFGAGATER